MAKKLAFVLGGGGALGALQVGALQALEEAGYRPDLWIGTSAGAINATFLAMRGFTKAALDELVSAWDDAAAADLLPANYLWLTVRTLFNRGRTYPYQRIQDFYIAHGLTPEVCFKDLPGPFLIQVATDINQHCAVLYGEDPRQSVLEGLLASTALPPWVYPLEVNGRLLMDGGLVSNLPIEPALSKGATQIIALDVSDSRNASLEDHRFGSFLTNLITTVSQRLLDLEMALAAEQQVPVSRIHLQAEYPIPVWDFSHTQELFKQGYQIANQEIDRWKPARKRWWQVKLLRSTKNHVPGWS